MRSFYKLFSEKAKRNPQRKAKLKAKNYVDYTSPEHKKEWIDFILLSDPKHLTQHEKSVQDWYYYLALHFPERADKYIENEYKNYLSRIVRPSKKGMEKIYEKEGVEVLLDVVNMDERVARQFDTPEFQKYIRDGVDYFLNYIQGILPNRKPKFIITDFEKNPHTQNSFGAAGIETRKNIFIHWQNINDPMNFVHEYAHYLTDIMSNQAKKLLKDAFNDLLKIFYRRRKKKIKTMGQISERELDKIAATLGFPRYGLMDEEEFFAMLIEKWREFPNTKATYKFKQIAKNIINQM